MTSAVVDQLPVPCMKLGEGPHWLEKDQALVYVDCFSKALRRHFIKSGRNQKLNIDDTGIARSTVVSFVVPVEGEPELFAVGLGNSISVVRWSVSDEDDITVKPTVLQTTKDDHFNDAKCDPQGRLWAGTMTPIDDKGEIMEFNTSCLWKYDHELQFTMWVKGVTISNGLAWSYDRKTFYYIDSPAKEVYAFDYDDAAGIIKNQRTILNYDDAGLKDQVPDGQTIDTDGNLWVACFGGGQVICIDPKQKKVIRQVSVPSKNVTSVCWGGPNYDILYVTTGTLKLSPQEIADNPAAGGTFAIRNLGAKGLPPTNFKVNLDKLRSKLSV